MTSAIPPASPHLSFTRPALLQWPCVRRKAAVHRAAAWCQGLYSAWSGGRGCMASRELRADPTPERGGGGAGCGYGA